MSILPINYKKRCFNLKEGLDQSTTKIYFIKLYIYLWFIGTVAWENEDSYVFLYNL
jgi:hypothetical protein